MANARTLSSLAWYASIAALAVIALGAVTRLLDAGLGCPDWPGCYGHIIVPLTEKAGAKAAHYYFNAHFELYKAWLEMLHRYCVGGLSILIIGIMTIILSSKPLRSACNLGSVIFLLMLLIYQILLGQLTVTLKLLPIVVTQHLLGGMLILGSLWVVYLTNDASLYSRLYPAKMKIMLGASIVGLMLIIGQLFLGAWTSTNYASLSCHAFPECTLNQSVVVRLHDAYRLLAPVGVNYEGGVLPLDVKQTIHMTHRLGAVIVTVYFFILFALTVQQLKNLPEITKAMYSVIALLGIQICIGVVNVLFKLPFLIALMHTLVAALLLLAVLTLITKMLMSQGKVTKND